VFLKSFIGASFRLVTSISLIALGTTMAVQAVELSEKTNLGGYGELHFNYVKPNEGVSPAPILDFHRWVLLLNHRWTEQWAFAAELELEHNYVEGGEAKGELELEQAYIQFNPRSEFNFQIGVLLPAVGLLNDKHEPNLFLSVERAEYNKLVIPTTWFGNGAAVRGLIREAVNYSVVLMEGLDDRNFLAKDGIRSGRQKGFKSSLETVLLNTAVDYVAIPGINAGGALALNLLAHDPTNTHHYSSTLLGEVHAQYKAKGLWVQAEFGAITYNTKEGHSANLQNTMGFYADIGYDIARLWNAEELQLYPFVRYSQFNSGDKLGENGTVTLPTFGIACFPIEKVAFKIDYSIQSKKGVNGTAGLLNAGAGYAF